MVKPPGGLHIRTEFDHRVNPNMSELQPFKNYYNEEMAWRLGGMVAQGYSAFDREAFVVEVADNG